MNTLRESLLQRRPTVAASGQTSFSSDANALCLKLETSTGETWIFPWSHFVYTYYEKKVTQEFLTLNFAGHEITVTGRNLSALDQGLSSLNLETLRPTSPRDCIIDSDLTIETINVHRTTA